MRRLARYEACIGDLARGFDPPARASSCGFMHLPISGGGKGVELVDEQDGWAKVYSRVKERRQLLLPCT